MNHWKLHSVVLLIGSYRFVLLKSPYMMHPQPVYIFMNHEYLNASQLFFHSKIEQIIKILILGAPSFALFVFPNGHWTMDNSCPML